MKTIRPHKTKALFDDWPEKYDQWFETPIGTLVKRFEGEILLDLLRPSAGESILDAGCGTGVFTLDFLASGARITGLDISIPMLRRSRKKSMNASFEVVAGDLRHLPFADGVFDKSVSITTLEFIPEGKEAVQELFRVTRKGGVVVVATLNSLSPWAVRRKAGRHPIFDQAIFRSPEELEALASVPGMLKTTVHFAKTEDPQKAVDIEKDGQKRSLNTGAFVAIRWEKS